MFDGAALDREIEALEQKARMLDDEHAALERESALVDTELDAKHNECARVERDAETHYRAYFATKYEVTELEEEVRSLTKQCAFAEAQLAQLRSKAALDLAFRIDQERHGSLTVGTINGLRLGRFDNSTSSSHAQAAAANEWNEIHAALGQVCLCMQSLARKLNLDFDK